MYVYMILMLLSLASFWIKLFIHDQSNFKMNDTFWRISYKRTERNESDFLMFYILRELFANKINSVLIFFSKAKKRWLVLTFILSSHKS